MTYQVEYPNPQRPGTVLWPAGKATRAGNIKTKWFKTVAGAEKFVREKYPDDLSLVTAFPSAELSVNLEELPHGARVIRR